MRRSTRLDAAVGLDRLGSLHLNDSQTPLGSNRDRHATIGDGEIGRTGCAAFLSEPRFESAADGARDQGPSAGRAKSRAVPDAAPARAGGAAARADSR